MRGGLELELAGALAAASEAGRELLPERLGLAVAGALGLRVPFSRELESASEVAQLDLSAFPGDRLVVKMISSQVAHKSDLGGVAFCASDATALERAIDSIRRRVGTRAPIEGYSVAERIECGGGPGEEILIAAHWTDDFGPVAVLGLGGLEVERLSAEDGLAPVLSNWANPATTGRALPAGHPLVRFLTEPYRARRGRFELDALDELISRLLAFAEDWMSPERAHRIAEIEFNPVVMSAKGPTALDALVRRATRSVDIAPRRPTRKLEHLLRPSSIAVAGVSRQQNIGRLILANILRQGFDRKRLWVVKAGTQEIDGCRCVPSFGELPETVDLAVLAVAAARLPDLVEEIVSANRAVSLILIPGGVGERSGTETVAKRLEMIIRDARHRPGEGPIVNGGNCLGVRSLPGRFDTLFIPGHKLDFNVGKPAPLALLSQSGAFAVARASKLVSIDPRYVVTFGNQIDLTLGDYLDFLAHDPEISVFACYLEGFRPLDGRRFLRAVREISDSGRTVILYRAARTSAGALAAASHTASIAGSYRVTRDLTERAGGLVADTIEEFDDLVRTFCALAGKRPGAGRLGAVSNAGFEAVAIADNLNGLELATLTGGTRTELAKVFRNASLESIVAPGNPLDVTPMLGDTAFATTAAAILKDENVDLAIVGCVPLTGALETLPAADGHSEDLDDAGAIGSLLIELWRTTAKPWVAVIDGGSLYDPLACKLDRAGVPTFRTVDRALAALAAWARLPVRYASRRP